MEVLIGVLLGWALAASVFAAFRLLRPPRVISGEVRAMQEALHAATVTLPHLRRGLSTESAAKTVGNLRIAREVPPAAEIRTVSSSLTLASSSRM